MRLRNHGFHLSGDRVQSASNDPRNGALDRPFEMREGVGHSVIHDMTNFPEDSILYFTNFGPIRYIDDDDNTVGFLDWQGVLKAAEEGRAKIAQ